MAPKPSDTTRRPVAIRPGVGAGDIADWLRERIRRGRAVPGQRLVEIDITRETGGSRSRVREALRRLEAEGLVTIEEFRGASVRRASVAEIAEIYRARVALEGICAFDFAARGIDEDRDRLAELQAQLDAAVGERAPERFAALNAQWHGQIIHGARNELIATMLGRLHAPINRLLFESFYDEAWLRAANADHQAITHSILARDAPAAELRMRRHIEDGFATLSSIADEFAPGG